MATQETQRNGQNQQAERLANGLGWFSIGLGLAEVIAPRQLARFIGLKDYGGTPAVMRLYGLREIAAGIGILSQPQPAGWVWGRVAGDALDLASLGSALADNGVERARVAGATAAVLGVTALDVLCATQLSGDSEEEETQTQSGLAVTRTIIVDRSPEELYSFWRDANNFPKFMEGVESVQAIGQNRLHWVATLPGDNNVEWDSEILDDQPGRLISWRSVAGAPVNISGSIRFERAPGGRGTLVKHEVQLTPPGGFVGASLAKLFGKLPGAVRVQNDLRRFKQLVETGEVVQSDASIHIGMHPGRPTERPRAATA